MEEYFSADRLLELPINSVINIITESNGVQFTVSLIGVDNGKSIIISLPSIERASNPSAYAEMIETRRIRKEIRFPCALSCDISSQGDETYGAITNISIGGLLAECP